jgi:hypothetical protein
MGRRAEGNGEALKRIVPILLALAGFAERSARLPLPVRFVLLAILRHAQAVLWAKVERASWLLAETGADGRAPLCVARLSVDPPDELGGPAAATRLGAGFRLIALVVASLAAHLIAFADLAARRGWHAATALAVASSASPDSPSAPDTS